MQIDVTPETVTAIKVVGAFVLAGVALASNCDMAGTVAGIIGGVIFPTTATAAMMGIKPAGAQ